MTSGENGQGGGTELVRGVDLGVRRAGRWLVRHVDISVSAGEIVTLIGPNGSGKSTTAKLILGLMAPDEGRVELARPLSIGYVPQKLRIEPTLPMTVRRLMTLTSAHPARDIERALDEVGVAARIDAAVDTLSGGEFQRVLLARAIIRRPALLVLDEPVQGVDYTGEIALYRLIGELRDRLGCGILLISHDLHLVMAATDRVLCLNGHVCCQGTPQLVASDPEYRKLFGTRAAETLAVYHHHHDHHHHADGSIHADTDVEACGCVTACPPAAPPDRPEPEPEPEPEPVSDKEHEDA
jgi:zinc transport system ATP-binding protein